VEPSRFWLRRDDDDRARQVVYDEVQLNRYTDRQKRAILKAMARGRSASHRDIRQAARRARIRPRGERLMTLTLALAALAVLIILVAGRTQRPSPGQPIDASAAAQPPGETSAEATNGELTALMDKADRAWLSDVGAGKVAGANDGSDVLTLPQPTPSQDGVEDAAVRRPHARRDRPSQQP
jgi:hypothetical protein